MMSVETTDRFISLLVEHILTKEVEVRCLRILLEIVNQLHPEYRLPTLLEEAQQTDAIRDHAEAPLNLLRVFISPSSSVVRERTIEQLLELLPN